MKKWLSLLLILPQIVFAQEKLPELSGKIYDNNSAIVDAQITLQNTEFSAVRFSNNQGIFAFQNVPYGEYSLVVNKLGYVAIQEKITVSSSTSALDYKLQEDVLQLNQMVVTGTRNAVPMYDAPIIVNKISAKTLENTQSLSVAEGLNFSPGLRVENNCQNCGFTQLRMNGLDGAYSQILINSRPVFSALAGVYGLEMIPPNMIDRIEVVKGGGSALYGGNAIGGTVNIITKDPIKNQFMLGINQGFTDFETSDRTLQFSGSVVSEDLRKGFTAYGFQRNRDFWDANDDGFSELTALRNTTFGFDAFVKKIGKSKFKIHLNAINEWRRGGNEFSRQPHQTDITEQLEHSILGGGLSYEWMSDNEIHQFSAYTSAQFTQRDSYYGGGGRIIEAGDSLTEADLLAINAYGQSEDATAITGLQYNFEWKKNLVLTAGTEYQFNQVIDEMPGYQRVIDQTVSTVGSYMQVEWDPTPRLCIVGGGRFDYVSIDGNYDFNNVEFNNEHNIAVFVPRATVLYELTNHLKARGSYAQGYRTPQAFDEDLHIETVGGAARFIQLNSRLKNETSHSYTASLNYTKTANQLQYNIVAEGFYTLLSNPFILSNPVELPNGVAVIEKRNGEAAHVQGVNLEANVAIGSNWVIQTGVTAQTAKYQEAEIIWEGTDTENNNVVTSTEDLLRTPDLYGFATVNYTYKKRLNLSLSTLYTGQMRVPHVINPETEYTVIKETPEFFEANIKVSYEWKLQKNYFLEWFAGTQNIFNSYQEDLDTGADRDAGYVYGPMRPRTVFMGCKLKFN